MRAKKAAEKGGGSTPPPLVWGTRPPRRGVHTCLCGSLCAPKTSAATPLLDKTRRPRVDQAASAGICEERDATRAIGYYWHCARRCRARAAHMCARARQLLRWTDASKGAHASVRILRASAPALSVKKPLPPARAGGRCAATFNGLYLNVSVSRIGAAPTDKKLKHFTSFVLYKHI